MTVAEALTNLVFARVSSLKVYLFLFISEVFSDTVITLQLGLVVA